MVAVTAPARMPVAPPGTACPLRTARPSQGTGARARRRTRRVLEAGAARVNGIASGPDPAGGAGSRPAHAARPRQA